MGCAQSVEPPSSRRLNTMKLDNGYAKGARKSTGTDVVEKGRKSMNASVMNMDVEVEEVDGWPKWLIDNIPMELLKDIVPKRADSYVKLHKIGQGTYSNVYKARDRKTGRVVALKKVRFDTSERESVKFMAREIMILQKLDHPNIIKLQGLATSRMHYSLYLVLEYMPYDLSRILNRTDDNALSEPQIKCYMQQLLSGLEHCHEHGILHRDIKPSNLLIDRNGVLKIADFGLANFFSPQKKCPLTSRVVTLWYRAPELLLGCTDYKTGVDLWSVGCLMAEMFVGGPFLPGRSEVEQVHMIFKVCGTPSDDFYTRLKLSTALRPPQSYNSNLGEILKNFPSSSYALITTLLALDPARRGSAASALQNQFFKSSPLACDISGLPIISVDDAEDDEYVATKRHRRRERERKKTEEDKVHKSSDKSLFGSENLSKKDESPSRLYPSPVDEMCSRTESRPNAMLLNRSDTNQRMDP